MKIDAHQHFWQYNPVRDAWITEQMQVIQRDFLPKDLKPLLAENSIDGCVAVQADQSLAETDFLLHCAAENDFIKAVVGWVDLQDAAVEAQLERYLENKKFVGVRHIIQAESAGFMRNKEFLRGVRLLQKYGLTYDLLVYHTQLEEAIEFVKQFPNQKIVIDHLAKPNIKTAEIADWQKAMKLLGEMEHVSCKLSGMVTEADWENWKYEDFEPYLDVILESFGAERILFGSDWPVCLLAADYKHVVELVEQFVAGLSESEQEWIWGKSAVEFYAKT